jgi:hypothetical protein
MGKKSKVEDVKKAGAAAPVDSLFGNSSKVDSSLASLFATQVGASGAICIENY